MEWIFNNVPQNVAKIVEMRTGMTKEELLQDTKSYHVNNIAEAADLFIKHVSNGSKIGCFCDYDTDGINCSNNMKTLSHVLNVEMLIYVPKRFSDGYGIRPRHVDMFRDCKLLILCDNGIAAKEAIDKANEYGIDTIIIDHHEQRVDEDGTPVIPEATITIDPHITGGDFVDYCGAGLTFLFAKEILQRCNYVSQNAKDLALKKMNIFAAIGTVGDVVSLKGENRRIVKDGIQLMLDGYGTVGMKALLNAINLKEYMTSIDIGFSISPIFNAAGRLRDDGSEFVSQVVACDKNSPELIEDIDELVELNKQRKQISLERFKDAENIITVNGLKDNRFIVIFDEDGTLGINGITSGKITEKYKRPSIVFSPTIDPDLIKGSGRSPEWANLKAILDKKNSLIAAYGGHPAACGISLKKENLDKFIKAINEITPDIPEWALVDAVRYDISCKTSDVKLLTEAISKYGPYGEGNPEIVVRIDNVPLKASARGDEEFFMGADKQHVKLFSDYFDMVWFDGTKPYCEMGKPKTVSVVGTLGYNVWKGNSRIQLQVKDLIPA